MIRSSVFCTKIVAANAGAVESILRKANGRSRSYTYNTYAEIAAMVLRAEAALRTVLYRKDFCGAVWIETSGRPFSSDYGHPRNATKVQLERRSSDWYITHVEVVLICRRGGKVGQVYLTSAQQGAANKKLAEGFGLTAAIRR